jgi:transcriptional regulator with XRE-family HTH domain
MKNLIRYIVSSRATSGNQAAEKAGLSQGTISEWMSGKVSPGLEKYIQLCQGLGCRPGQELDNFLGLSQHKPVCAEDVLGQVLSLKRSEQSKLIALISAKHQEQWKIKEMINIECLIELINEYFQKNNSNPRKFAKECGISMDALTNILHGFPIGNHEELEVQLSLLSSVLVNPLTGDRFASKEELIDYCLNWHSPAPEPNGKARR